MLRCTSTPPHARDLAYRLAGLLFFVIAWPTASAAGPLGVDLLATQPRRHQLVTTVPLTTIDVVGDARATLRGDTLEVVLTGHPGVSLRMPWPLEANRSVDHLVTTLAASTDLWITAAWSRDGTRSDAAPAIAVRAGAPTPVHWPLEPRVGEHGWERATALEFSLPAVVGRIQIVGPVQLWGSSAPRCVFRTGDESVAGRALRAGGRASWDCRVPPDAVLLVDVAALETLGAGLGWNVEIDAGEGAMRVLSESLPAATRGDRWRHVELDLRAFAGREVEVRIAAEGPATAPDRGRLFLATPRIVSRGDTPPPVLLIVIDTLRRHDPRGDRQDSRPRLLEFERQAIAFDQARAPSSWTLPSTASLLSGWIPSRHGLGHGPAGTTRLHPGAPSLAAELRAAGWSTAAVSANPLVVPGSGLERGFERFDRRAAADPRVPSAQIAVRDALEWLRPRRGTPWMLYLHLFDPHDPYQAPEPWRTRFVEGDRRAAQHPTGVWEGRPDPLRADLIAGADPRTVRDSDLELLAQLHRGEIAYVDHQVGALLDSLRAWNEFERSVIVVTSDHGEEFLEHGMLKHGHALHEELIAVPLALHLPETSPRRVPIPVSLVDLAPTLRARLGLAARSGEGHDLAPWIFATEDPPRAPATLAELVSRAGGPWEGPQRAVIDGPWKWIETPRGELLFRLDLDPGEQRDVGAFHPEILTRLRAHADSVRASFEPSPPPEPVDPRTLEALRTLGYVD